MNLIGSSIAGFIHFRNTAGVAAPERDARGDGTSGKGRWNPFRHSRNRRGGGPASSTACAWQDWKPAEHTPHAPMFDPQDLRIDTDVLMYLARELANALPATRDKVALEYKDRLNAVFMKLFTDAHAARGVPHSPAAEAALALAARDGFAEAAKLARKLAKTFDGGNHGACDAARCSALAELCVALKRAHLAAGARHILDAFVQREAAKLSEVVPGFVQKRSGSQLSKSKGISAFLRIGPVGSVLAGGGVSKTGRIRLDDDLDFDRLTEWRAHLGLGWKIGIGSSIAFIKKALVSGKLGGGLGSGYRKSASFVNLLKSDTVREADNAFARSAAPARRGRDAALRKLEQAAAAPARTYHRSHDIPFYLSQEKVAKGAFNRDLMLLFAQKVDGAADGRLAKLIGRAFPGHDENDVDGKPVSPMTYVPVNDTGGTTGRHGRERLPFKAVNMEFSATAHSKSRLPFGYRWRAGAVLAGEWRKLGLEKLHPSHVLLDAAYNKNIGQSLRMLRELENAPGYAARLHLYREGNRLVSSDSEGDKTQSGWPAAFLDTHGCTDRAARLRMIEEACARLAEKYRRLVAAAGTLNAARNHLGGDRNFDAELKARMQSSFDMINNEIWGGGYVPEGGWRKSNRRPDLSDREEVVRLLAGSYDAVSLALGAAGAHLTMLKLAMADGGGPRSEKEAQRLAAADYAYRNTRELLDAVDLPVSHERLFRQSAIVLSSSSRKAEVKGSMGATGGFKANVPEAALNAIGMDGDESVNVTVSNSAGSVGVDVSVSYQDTTHPNPGREGKFIDITAKAGAGFPIASIVQNAATVFRRMEKASGRGAGRGTTLPEDAAQPPQAGFDVRKLIADIKSVGMESSLCADVSIRLHAFPQEEKKGQGAGSGYRMNLQYVRFARGTHTGVGVEAGVGGGLVHVGGEITARTEETASSPELELMGRDLGYHMLQLPLLDDVLRSDPEEPSAEVLAARLNADTYLKHRYFGNNIILRMVKAHAKFLDDDAAKGDDSGKSGQQDYDFSFYHQQRYADLLSTAAANAHHAPGSEATSPAPGSILERMNAPHLSLDELAQAKKKLKAKLSLPRGHAGLSDTDIRMRYFLADPNGRKIFDAYRQIVQTYKDANAALTLNGGYKMHLRDHAAVQGKVRAADEQDVLRSRLLRKGKRPGGNRADVTQSRTEKKDSRLHKEAQVSTGADLRRFWQRSHKKVHDGAGPEKPDREAAVESEALTKAPVLHS